jgi:hypothetical protein
MVASGPVSRAVCSPASRRSPTSARSYRPASTLPTPTAGLTTYVPLAGGSHGFPGSTQAVSTAGTPAADSSRRYRLSAFQAMTSAGLAKRGTADAHARNSSRRAG